MSTLSWLKLSGIRNFDPDEEQEIKFDTPVTLFLGQNGCGKTSIVESIKYAITGVLPAGTDKGRGFLHDPQINHKTESRAHVKLKIYDIDGNPLTVTKVSKVTQNKCKLNFTSLDNLISRGPGEIISDVIDVKNEMGVSEAILNNVLFCHQEDSYWPLEEPKKLKEKFDKIFDSDNYNKCIERIIKLKKEKMIKFGLLAKDFESNKSIKVEMEKKKGLLCEKEARYAEMELKVQNINEAIIPLQKNLEDIHRLEKDKAEKETLNSQINDNKVQQNDIVASIKEIECSDAELESRICSFQSDTEKAQNEMEKLKKENKQIEEKEIHTREEVNKNHFNLGTLQEENEQNNQRIDKQLSLVNSIQSGFAIELTSNSDMPEKIKKLEQKLQSMENEILNFEKKIEENEKLLQENIDSCRTKYVQVEQDIKMKNERLTDLNLSKENVSQLIELNTYNQSLLGTENDLKHFESQLNVNQLKQDIENEKTKYQNLQDQLQNIEKEIQILTELDLNNENLLKKQNDKQHLYNIHKSDLDNIFNHNIPENNLKLAIDKYKNIQLDIIEKININITSKEKEVHKLEAGLNIQKEKLNQMKIDQVKDKATIDEIFQGQTFENVEKNINAVIDELQTQKGEFTNSIQLYTNFIEKFKSEKPCCPICMRDVTEKYQSNKIITEIEKKIKDFPILIEQTEVKLTKELSKQTNILILKPTYYKIQQIESIDLPALKKLIVELSQDLAQQTKLLNALKEEIIIPTKNQQLANNILSDATLIDQYDIEIKELKTKMPQENPRNIQEAYFEQEKLKSSTKETHQKLNFLTQKLIEYNEQLDRLNLVLKRIEIEKEISDTCDALQKVQDNIESTKASLDKAIKTKVESKKSDKEKKDKLKLSTDHFKKLYLEIKMLNEEICICNKKNIEQNIDIIQRSLESYNDELNYYTYIKNSITKQIDVLKDQVSNKEKYSRELLVNKKLRGIKSELKILLEKYKELEIKIEQDMVKLQFTDGQQVDKKISDYNREVNKLEGERSELERAIIETKNELSEPKYANAIQNYKDLFFEYKILGQAIKDLDIFVTAFNSATIEYHKQQMVHVNDTIRDLWRSIYRGNDIDYIEIKPEIEETTTRRSVYKYKLLQVKNDVKIEMRGRCSAGQKVLASLVVRIALADTFSTKCGILALDEPTTNLDEENIGSVCDALCELINKRRNHKNFQLLIITHDQEFLEKLSRDVLIENYVHVSRNENGKSVVTIKPVIF